MKRCLQCGIEITGHPSKKFCSNKGPGNCKSLYRKQNPKPADPEEYLDEYSEYDSLGNTCWE